MSKNIDKTLESVVDYFNDSFQQYGAKAEGVDYNSEEAQIRRFSELEKILDKATDKFTLLDYGCGYGALPLYLQKQGYDFKYIGYDISKELVAAANENIPDNCDWKFTANLDGLEPVDYVIACGVFNIKLNSKTSEWESYFYDQINVLSKLSLKGFSFNTLTSYSDEDRMSDKLYYPDPKQVFDFCVCNHSRHVALLHDYKLYDCTYLVRKS